MWVSATPNHSIPSIQCRGIIDGVQTLALDDLPAVLALKEFDLLLSTRRGRSEALVI
jgi:hypothetical protein